MRHLLAGLIFLSCSFLAKAQQHQEGNMYLFYPAKKGDFYNIDQEITIDQLAPGTFWALTFNFNELSDGGYIGVQTGYSDTDSGMLIFSIWNGIAAEKGDAESYVVDFGGEGVGKSCRISIPLAVSHTYRLRVWRLESDASGTYWGAWIKDNTLDKEYYLGKIKTNKPATLSNYVSNFVEYYGDQKPCREVPFSRAKFYNIKLNCNDEDNSFQFQLKAKSHKYAACAFGKSRMYKNYALVNFGGK